MRTGAVSIVRALRVHRGRRFRVPRPARRRLSWSRTEPNQSQASSPLAPARSSGPTTVGAPEYRFVGERSVAVFCASVDKPPRAEMAARDCGTSCSSPARPGSLRSKPPQFEQEASDACSRVPRPRSQGLGRGPQADDRRRHRRHRPRRRGHDLRHRPAHPQGRRPRRDRRTDPRPRGGRHRRGGRCRRQDREGRRPRARVVHHRLRHVPVLPRGPLRPVPRRRRLDPRPQDRRHPGGVRAGAVRRHVDLPCPRRCGRRADAHARRHPPHRLRGRRPQRSRATRRRRRRRRRRADRPGRDHGRPAVQPQPRRRDRPRRQPARGRRSSSAPTSRSTTVARTRWRSCAT